MKDLLLARQKQISKRWLDKIFESYPSDTSRFLSRESNPFANPVGRTFEQETSELCRLVLEGPDPEQLVPHLERIIKIRAIQNLSPSKAVSFVYLLKAAIREELGDCLVDSARHHGLEAIDRHIDQLALLSFDVYVKSREKIYEIRIAEIKRNVSRLLSGSGIFEPSEPDDSPHQCSSRGSGR